MQDEVEVVLVDIAELNLLDRNPRTITKAEMQKLCNSIKKDPTFMQRRPVLVNSSGGKYTVYAGNQRVRACHALKWDKVPCIIDVDLDETIMKDRIIADNSSNGDWDFDILAADYEVENLLEYFDEKELIEELPMDIEEKKDERKKKMHLCPECGFSFQ